ncbi:MAG: replicative DNA helicase [Planctomycetaceae bacterium]|nr:replicative DNA helicase [Planctomycetaceae bacterium]
MEAKTNGRPHSGNPSELLDRQPPVNLDAEIGVLGSIMLKSELLDEVALILRVTDFYDDANRKIYEHLLHLWNNGGKIDHLLLVEALKGAGDLEAVGGKPYLARLAGSVPLAVHATYYATIVRAKALRRDVIDAGTEIVRRGYDEQIDDEEVLSVAENRIFRLAERQTDAHNTHSAIDFMRATMDRVEGRKNGKAARGLPTGIDAIDDMMGGLLPGTVTIVAARTSMGKSALACNIAEHAAIKLDTATLFISLEMSVEEIGDRLLASQARVDSHHIRQGTYSNDERLQLVEAAGRISNAPLFMDDCPTRNMTSIAALARRHKRKHSIGLLIVDYLQLIDPDSAKDPRQEQVARIARRLKVLAREIQVPIVCLAQLNRQTEMTKDNIPKLSHLRESGAIEQDADVVLFVHRPGYYSRESTPAGQGEPSEIIVAKQRNGPTGTANVLWFGSYLRFDNAEPEWKRSQNYTP